MLQKPDIQLFKTRNHVKQKTCRIIFNPCYFRHASHALSNTASQTLQATLGTYLDIQALSSGAVTTTTIAPDTGALATALISKFQIQANANAPSLYLKATTASTTNPSEVAFFQQSGTTYVILSNTTNMPLTSAIADCKLATPTLANNANAIAYPIASSTATNSGTVTFDGTKNQYNVSANAGQTVVTTTTGTTPLANTYSYLDTAGTYQAILTLSNTSL